LVKGKFGIKWSRRRRRRRGKEGEKWGTMFRCMQAVARVAVYSYAKSSSVVWLSFN
jgi:hypothetical protein